MKRLALSSILMSVGAYAACAVEEPPPPSETGGTGNVAGVAGTGQGGATAGVAGATTGGTTGGTITTGGTTGGTITTGGAGGLPPTGGSGGLPPTGGMGGDTGMGGSPMGGDGAGGNPMGGSPMGGSPMGGSPMGGSPMGGSPMGGAGTGGGGTCPECPMVATVLHGHTILMPCGANTEVRVCTPRTVTTRPCTGMPSAAYAGGHSHNQQVTLGGTAGVTYIVSLRIRGLVEAKTFTGGMERTNTGTQVPADGLYTGGAPNNSANGYNIYFIRTDNPAQFFYLNSVGAGNDNRIRHSVFEVDMALDIPVVGGSTVCLVSADPNTSAIKNCAEPDVGNVCPAVTLPNLDPLITADIVSQPYNGQFIGMTVTGTRRM